MFSFFLPENEHESKPGSVEGKALPLTHQSCWMWMRDTVPQTPCISPAFVPFTDYLKEIKWNLALPETFRNESLRQLLLIFWWTSLQMEKGEWEGDKRKRRRKRRRRIILEKEDLKNLFSPLTMCHKHLSYVNTHRHPHFWIAYVPSLIWTSPN